MEIIEFTEFIFHSAAALDCVPSWALALVVVALVVVALVVVALVVVGSGVSVVVSIRVGSQRAIFSEQQQKMPETNKTDIVRKQTVALEAEWSKAVP